MTMPIAPTLLGHNQWIFTLPCFMNSLLDLINDQHEMNVVLMVNDLCCFVVFFKSLPMIGQWLAKPCSTLACNC
jgi:hypothetical protein